jgi:hypothetical protein
MSHHMTIEGVSFKEGVKAGLHDAQLHLAFLPLVGRWFVDSREKPHDDDYTD